MENNKTPLWLPEGSIRGLIAIALVSAVIYISLNTGDIPEAIAALAGVAVTFYFKTRET